MFVVLRHLATTSVDRSIAVPRGLRWRAGFEPPAVLKRAVLERCGGFLPADWMRAEGLWRFALPPQKCAAVRPTCVRLTCSSCVCALFRAPAFARCLPTKASSRRKGAPKFRAGVGRPTTNTVRIINEDKIGGLDRSIDRSTESGAGISVLWICPSFFEMCRHTAAAPLCSRSLGIDRADRAVVGDC